MKRITIINQPVISQKIIDIQSQVAIRFFKDGDKFGFQFLKTQYEKEFDPFFNSKLNWFFGHWHTLHEATLAAENYYFDYLSNSSHLVSNG